MSISSKITNEPCEYDHYPIPPFDPTIPPEERARLKAEAEKRLDAIIRATAAKYRKQ